MYRCQYTSKGKALGEGSFGEVSLVERNGHPYVMKKMKVDKDEDGEFEPSTFQNPIEIDIMFRLKSPYLVEGVDITVAGECDPNSVGLVQEFIGGNLLEDVDKLSYQDKKRCMLDIALGLKCLHANKFLHLDIKLENTLYHKEKKPRAVLIDYGLVAYCPNGVVAGVDTSDRGTVYYYSPKVAKAPEKETFRYTNKDDIWSLGITFCEFMVSIYEVYSMLDANSTDDDKKFLKKIHQHHTYYLNKKNINEFLEQIILVDIKLPKKEKELFKSLIKGMLDLDEEKRFDIDDVIAHPFFNGFNESKFCMQRAAEVFSLEYVDVNIIKKGIDTIMYKAKEFIPDRPLEILFMAIDIYLRVLSQASEDVLSKYPDLSSVCLLIASKYFFWADVTEKFDLEIFDRSEEENIIFKIIGGRIREERYFPAFTYLEEAQSIYNIFLKPEEPIGYNPNIVKYLEYNGKQYVEDLNISDGTSIKNATINDLL